MPSNSPTVRAAAFARPRGRRAHRLALAAAAVMALAGSWILPSASSGSGLGHGWSRRVLGHDVRLAAAPVLVPAVFRHPDGHPNLPCLFRAGFDIVEILDSGGADRFQWVQSAAQAGEWYLVNRATAGDPAPLLSAVPLRNVRALLAGSFTADSAANTVDAGDQSKTGVGSAAVTFSTTGTLRANAQYRFTCTVAMSAGTAFVTLTDGLGAVVGEATRTTSGAVSFACNTGASSAVTVSVRVTSATADFTAISLVQESATFGASSTDPSILANEGTPGALGFWSAGFGDADGLGFPTLYVRLSDAESPATNKVGIVFDQTDPGDGSGSEECHCEWWIDRASSGLNGWPDRYRFVVDRRLDGTPREGELVDLAGRPPSASVGSPVRGRSWSWAFTEGTWLVRVRVWNRSGEYTDHAFEPIVIGPDTRTPYTVHHAGPADFPSLEAAVAAIGATDNISVRCLNGHINPETTATIVPGGHNWRVWCAEGETAHFSSNPLATSGGATVIEVDRKRYTVIEGLTGTPTTTGGNRGRGLVLLDRAYLSAVIACRVNLRDNAPNGGYGYCVGTENTGITSNTAPENRLFGALVLNCSSQGTDDYFWAGATCNRGEDHLHLIGCDIGVSQEESGIRTTSAAVSGMVVAFCAFDEDEKDDSRVTKAVGCDLIGNYFRGSSLVAAGTTDPDKVSGVRYEGNRFRRVNRPTVTYTLGSDAGYRGVWIGNNLFDQEVAANCGMLTVYTTRYTPGSASPSYAYQSAERLVVVCNTFRRAASSGQTSRPAVLVNPNPRAATVSIRGNVFSDESGGSWTAAAIDNTGGAVLTANSVKANHAVSVYGVPAAPTLDAALTGVPPYDMWGNRRSDGTVLGSAVAVPPDAYVPPVDPGPAGTGSPRVRANVRARFSTLGTAGSVGAS